MEQVEARKGEFAQDRNTMSTFFGNLGRAAEAMQDYQRAMSLWKQYLENSPGPVDLPTGFFHLAECHRGLGDHQTALELYRRAVGLNLETHESRRARARLEEPGYAASSLPPGPEGLSHDRH